MKDYKQLKTEYATITEWLQEYDKLDKNEQQEYAGEHLIFLLNRADVERDLHGHLLQYVDIPYISDLESDDEPYTVEEIDNALRTIREVEGVDIALCDMYEPADCENCCDEIE